MNYSQLSEFIDKKMRMSHIYQPVMLIELLANEGTLTDSAIAEALLAKDLSQIEYYTNITNSMVGRILRKHAIVEKDNKTKEYSLIGYTDLSPAERESLIAKAQKRLDAYMDQQGENLFDHRRKAKGYISGSIRYTVLKRAKFHCELCGISAEKKALEVDHIVPRNNGGSDDITNLQCLCYSCNAMKRDTDDTDFRIIRESFEHRQEGCLFCETPAASIIAENALAFAIRDGFPVTKGHTLIIPKRHVPEYFELGQAEINACTALLKECKEQLQSDDSEIKGFNIGINNGEAAGQTIMHCHIHLIPRRSGDVDDPVGGVRHVIPNKGNYKKIQKTK